MIRIEASRPFRFSCIVAIAVALGGCDRPAPDVDYPALASLRSLGLAYLEEGRPAEAAREFAILTEKAADEALGPANLAVAELRRGAFGAAIEAVNEARRRAPDDPEVLFIGATVLTEMGRDGAARDLWRLGLVADSLHVPSLWALATRDSSLTRPLLERLLGRQPANLPARLQLAEAYVRDGMLDAAVGHVEYLRQLLPRGDDEAKTELDAMLKTARTGDQQAALKHLRTLHNLLRIDAMYGSDLRRLAVGRAEAGVPLELFRQLKPSRQVVENAWRDIRFVVRDSLPGIESPLLTDFDGDGDQDLVAQGPTGRLICLRNTAGKFGVAEDCTISGFTPVGRPMYAADFDGDARTDIIMLGPEGLSLLSSVDGLFGDPMPVDLTSPAASVWSVQALDVDHDGDLDLLVGGEQSTRLYQQTSPGKFMEVGQGAGIADLSGVLAWSFGDLDGDGDLDLVTMSSDSVRILWNLRQGHYRVGPAISGDSAPSGVIVIDVDHDGDFDILVTSSFGLSVSLNRGAGEFDPFKPAVEGQRGPGAAGLVPIDFDNDGRRDVLLYSHGDSGRMTIARGMAGGVFADVAGAFPAGLLASEALVADIDGDGDEDLIISHGSGLLVLSNEGGNLNHHMTVELLALADGSGKVNRLGLGSRIDVTAGDLHISRVVSREIEHFGLGSRSAADVVRIEWTNGVPQNVFRPAIDERLVETQLLKGSCGFLYVWTGERFEFVTDMMWKSALGMPLGIMAGETFYAPPDPSLEYVRIPPGMLLDRDGWYEIRITEELWEVGYLDEVALIAVDHPTGSEVYVNEAFATPDVANEQMYIVQDPLLLEAAYTDGGVEVSSLLAARDFQFVGGFKPGPFQGTTQLHDLVLTLKQAADRPVRLFLSGWLFPTDASINVAIGQAGEFKVVPPYIEVADGTGGWKSSTLPIAFPTGKNKTVIVDLPEGLPAGDPRMRIRTNMEIYWDEAFYQIVDDESRVALLNRRLEPASAQLGVRGFSRVYRRGGRYGPHWFNYSEVQEESPWRPMTGTYTRLGDVLPLLVAADDQYVVFGPGDEMELRFEALPPPAAGKTRTFFLYSDAFLKDADLNTLGGGRVEPLPRHGQNDYPGGVPEPDSAHAEFIARYQTRIVK